jgi:DNA polymerase-3 subunit delta'
MAAMEWGQIGNGWAVDLLRRQVTRGSTHHAYLISGPEGVGRGRLALSFARALLCENPSQAGDTCGECRACVLVPERKYPDLHWVERLEDKQGITIEQVRDLQRQLALASFAGGGRVAVLVDVDRASEGAANALLKTLEEPGRRVHLLLTAGDVEEVPPTIASRCEILALRPVPTDEIAAALQAQGESAGTAQDLARLALGRPELALRMAADPGLRARRQAHAETLKEILALGLVGRFALAERWKDDENMEERLAVWLGLLGETLRRVADGRRSSAEAAFPTLSGPDQTRQALEAGLRTLEALRRNANQRLALETMMLDLPRSDPGG